MLLDSDDEDFERFRGGASPERRSLLDGPAAPAAKAFDLHRASTALAPSRESKEEHPGGGGAAEGGATRTVPVTIPWDPSSDGWGIVFHEEAMRVDHPGPARINCLCRRPKYGDASVWG